MPELAWPVGAALVLGAAHMLGRDVAAGCGGCVDDGAVQGAGRQDGVMEISDEAIEFVELLSEATDMCLGDCLGDLAEDMRAGNPRERSQRVATVIEGHARSAQVAVLRELADELGDAWWGAHRDGNDALKLGLTKARMRVSAKRAELEAGAGQTEVRDGR